MKKSLLKAGLLFSSVFLLVACGNTEDQKAVEKDAEPSTEQVEGEAAVEGEGTTEQTGYAEDDPRTTHINNEEQHYLVSGDPLNDSGWTYMLEAFSDKDDKVSFAYFYYVGEGNLLDNAEDVKGAYKSIVGEETDKSDEDIIKEINGLVAGYTEQFIKDQSLSNLKAESTLEKAVLEHFTGAIAQLLMMVENPEGFMTAGDMMNEVSPEEQAAYDALTDEEREALAHTPAVEPDAQEEGDAE